ERNELRAVTEMTVAAAIAVGRGDGRCAERAAVIAALEREHQALALLEVADELKAVLHCLAAADIEMHAAFLAKFLLGILGNHRRKFDLLAMQVLTRNLRQTVELAAHRSVQARVAIAEIDGRVPHLQVEELTSLRVVDKRALAMIENLRRIRVVDGIA